MKAAIVSMLGMLTVVGLVGLPTGQATGELRADTSTCESDRIVVQLRTNTPICDAMHVVGGIGGIPVIVTGSAGVGLTTHVAYSGHLKSWKVYDSGWKCYAEDSMTASGGGFGAFPYTLLAEVAPGKSASKGFMGPATDSVSSGVWSGFMGSAPVTDMLVRFHASSSNDLVPLDFAEAWSDVPYACV